MFHDTHLLHIRRIYHTISGGDARTYERDPKHLLLKSYILLFFLSPGYGSGTGKVYTNGVYKIETSLDLDALSLLLKTIETIFGRDKKKSNGEVALDLDIVETDNVVVREKELNQYPYKQGKNELDEITKTNKTSVFSSFRKT